MPNLPQQSLKPAHIIKSQPALEQLASLLQNQPYIAVDTESNSMYAYYEQVCLIQISICNPPDNTTDPTDYIIDPFAVEDMSPLGDVFAAPNTEIIFHAAEYDVMCLKRDYGFEFNRIFDTYIAARTLGWEHVGLGALLETHFGIQLNKKFQQADWSLRPLSTEQLRYAQMDTHFLPALRQLLLNLLIEQDYVDEASEYFAELAQTPAAHKEIDLEGFWRIKTPRHFTEQEFGVLRELYLWREEIAEKRNRPPFKVMSNNEIAAIAANMPQNMSDLRAISGLSKSSTERYGQALLRVVERGQQYSLSRPRQTPHPDPEILARFEALQEWRKQKAELRGVSSDIILSKSALWALAHRMPNNEDDLATIGEIGPHRRKKYASELLNVLAKLSS